MVSQQVRQGKIALRFPCVVEADAWLADRREIVIMVSVSQGNNPSMQGKENNQVFFAQLVTTREKIMLKHLSDLPAALVRTHEPHQLPEIAQ